MSSNNNNSYIITDDSVTIVYNDEVLSITSDHMNFEAVKESLKEMDYETAESLCNVSKAVNAYGNSVITVSDGEVYYKGTPMHNSLTARIMRMMREGYNVEPMFAFMENLMENPSMRAVNELYRFLECNSLPITEDGYFLAYKNVNYNYKDRHSGTFDNSIGSVCEMPRNMVADNPEQTCSTGLHFCSIEYLNKMWGHDGHTMIVRINPADVVSIPTDYNNSKGRCCRYEVIAEHFDEKEDTLSKKSVYTYHNKRDEFGRFTAA